MIIRKLPILSNQTYVHHYLGIDHKMTSNELLSEKYLVVVDLRPHTPISKYISSLLKSPIRRIPNLSNSFNQNSGNSQSPSEENSSNESAQDEESENEPKSEGRIFKKLKRQHNQSDAKYRLYREIDFLWTNWMAATIFIRWIIAKFFSRVIFFNQGVGGLFKKSQSTISKNGSIEIHFDYFDTIF